MDKINLLQDVYCGDIKKVVEEATKKVAEKEKEKKEKK